MNQSTAIAITLSKLRAMIHSDHNVSIDNDFLLTRVTGIPDYNALKYPFLVNCFVAAYCVSGDVECTVNLDTYRLSPGTLLLIVPGSIIRINPQKLADAEDIRYTIICATDSFIADTGIDSGKFLTEVSQVLKDPCLHFSADEAMLLRKYIDLCFDVVKVEPPFLKGCISGLASSIFYQVAGALAESKRKEDLEKPVRTTRQKAMLEQFIKLVSEYHVKEHLVGFYADRLCVTPKYLSKVIKAASGRSVPEWISDLIILDAKNLLRHSGMTIKEISDTLNFPSQSFFFRYFKQHTGQTPTQYREE